MISINLTGRLTREPELRDVEIEPAGRSLDACEIRVASRNRRGDTVYMDLAEWGAAGRAAAERLRKGSRIAFSGDLRFKEVAGETGPRQYVSAVGHIEFLDARPANGAPPADAPGSAAADLEADDEIAF